ncbi:MAG: hypothetical protein ACTTJH_05595 [Bacteroidales bacterium]
MKILKIYKKICVVFTITFAVSLLLDACDTNECIDNDSSNYKKIEKAAPGTNPIREKDC